MDICYKFWYTFWYTPKCKAQKPFIYAGFRHGCRVRNPDASLLDRPEKVGFSFVYAGLRAFAIQDQCQKFGTLGTLWDFSVPNVVSGYYITWMARSLNSSFRTIIGKIPQLFF